jgi:alkaline phosphatase
MSRFLFVSCLLMCLGCASNRRPAVDFSSVQFTGNPKNIILLIGDGMGLAQVSAQVYWAGKRGSIFEQFPYVGFHKSQSCNDLTTDSAAGATAFSCGEKTTNGAIGVLPPDNAPCTTILEDLDSRGYATGMVVTCTATHATPASFIAHREMRAFTEEIALDYLKTSFDCLFAGGESLFQKSKRSDKLNLLDSLKARGYVLRHGVGFKNLPMAGEKPFVVFTYQDEPPTASSGRQYLSRATRICCEYLPKRSEKGFFLMVEGSQIDWAGHSNDRAWMKAEMADFEKTVQAAVEFAAQDKQTLVIVTGDHECGGMSLNEGDTRKSFKARFSGRLHTPALVPVYAYGPQAERFNGIYENTLIYRKMRNALGIEMDDEMPSSSSE